MKILAFFSLICDVFGNTVIKTTISPKPVYATKVQISLRIQGLISAFVLCCLDSIILILAKYKISKL